MREKYEKIIENKKDILKTIIPSLLLISAYLLFIFQSTKEIPFIYNQF